MKTVLLFATCFLLLVQTSCIAIYTNSDGSGAIPKSEWKKITGFELPAEREGVSLSAPEDVVVQEVNAEQLFQLMLHQDYTWIYIPFGCGELAPARFLDSIKGTLSTYEKQMRFVPVFTQYDPKSIQNMLFENQLGLTAYIINRDDYGTTPALKLARLLYQLCPQRDPFTLGPQYLLFNRDQQLRYAADDSEFSMDSIISIVKKP